MKKISYLLLFALSTFACGGEPQEDLYTFLVTNESAHAVRITFYDGVNTITFSNTFDPGQRRKICDIYIDGFISFLCASDSAVVEFDNNKGYICDLRPGGADLCFQNKSFYGASRQDFEDLGGLRYNFIITEEDYENAFELPE